ncbi:MAG: hypothetical protein ACLTSX_00710 [Collinsella sp.]
MLAAQSQGPEPIENGSWLYDSLPATRPADDGVAARRMGRRLEIGSVTIDLAARRADMLSTPESGRKSTLPVRRVPVTQRKARRATSFGSTSRARPS